TKEAEALYLELVQLDLEKYGKDDPKYWDSEVSLLDFYSFAQQPNKGLETSKRLRKVFDRNSAENAIRIKSEGDYNEMLGYYTKAERSYRQSISLLEELDMIASDEYIGATNALAILYLNTGKLPQADELFQKAQEIANRLQDTEDVQASLSSNMAQVYFELGNYDEAEKTYTKLLADDLEYYGEESANYGFTAYNLGKNQLYAQKYSDARKYFDLANTVFSKALEENSPEIAYLLNLQIRLNIGLGDPDRALEFGEQAFKMYPKVFGEDHFETAYPHFNIGNAHMALDDLDKATEHHLRALAIREKALGKSHPLYAESTRQLAILEWKKGNNSAALDYFQKTFDNYYLQINNYFPILNEEQKTKFYYNKLRPTVEQFNAFVVKAAPDDRSLQGKMYDYQLTLKGIILSATTKVKQAILTSGDSVLIGKYETWLGQKENLAQLFSDSEMEETLRNKRIDSLTTSSANLEKELSKLSAGFASTIESKQPSWTDIRSKLKIGEAAVEMVRFRDFATDSAGIFTDEVYYAALIVKHDSENPDMVLIRNGQQMETRFLANYRNSIKYKIVESRSYNLYWRPIANKLEGIKRVYFSPDGVYNQISINTLNNSESKEFNLDEFEIWQMNNTRDLLTLGSKNTSTGKSVFFGYPNYNLGSVEEGMKEGGSEVAAERGGRGGSKGKELDLTKVSIPRGLRGNMLRYMRSNSLLVLLPGTKKEIELIDSLYENASIERDVFLS
ncbi:MAG: tetratricopeptide repeat protein, partial [Cyclobacteriaceae bacterium]